MTYFSFNILSTTHTIFKGDITQVLVCGVEGNMTLLSNHMPIISALSAGDVTIWLDESKESSKVFPISGGFVDMKNNECTIFVSNN